MCDSPMATINWCTPTSSIKFYRVKTLFGTFVPVCIYLWNNHSRINMQKLENKTAVVTGGNSGIGYATVEELRKLGAKVVFTGLRQDVVAEAAKNLGVTGVVSDQADLDQIDLLVKKASEELGKVDILVVNAGIFSVVPFELVTEQFYDNMMNINQ